MKKITLASALMAAIMLFAACTNDTTLPADSTDTRADVTETNTDKESSETEAMTETETETAPATDSSALPEALEQDDYNDGSWVLASMKEQILATDENWAVTGTGASGGLVYYDGYAGVKEHDSLFDIACLNYLGDEVTYKFDFDLWTAPAETPLDDPVWMTLFIGLRAQDISTNASNPNSCIWLTFKDGHMGVAGSQWPQDIYQFPLPYDFNDGFRRVFIEDNQRKNVITVYIENDDGMKMPVYILKPFLNIDTLATSISVYSYEDGFKDEIEVIDKDLELMVGGFVKMWNHNRGGVYIKEIAFKVEE